MGSRCYEKGCQAGIVGELSAADPTNENTRGDLVDGLMRASDLALRLGSGAEAVAGYRKALAIAESALAEKNEDNDARHVLALLCEKLGDYDASHAAHSRVAPESWRTARTWYQKSLVDWKYLEDHKTRDDNYVKHPRDVVKKMAKCDAALNGKTGK